MIAAGPDGALWFTEVAGNKIGRITTGGSITEFAIPTAKSQPAGIAAGPDGALWFTEYGANKIGRVTTRGSISEFPIPTANSNPLGIAPGPDGALWFTEEIGTIGRITTAGKATEFPGAGAPNSIVAGPDEALWFTHYGENKIGRITTAGALKQFAVPGKEGVSQITAGPDGALWFTEANAGTVERISVTGRVAAFPLPASSARQVTEPEGIVTGPDGALWVADHYAKIWRITTAGTFTQLRLEFSPTRITAGPDRALWFTSFFDDKIGRFELAPPGVLGAPRNVLVAELRRNGYRVRRGRSTRLGYLCTRSARVTLEVRKHDRMLSRSRARARRGANIIKLREVRTAGRYRLRLIAHAANQTSTDTATLRVTR